MKLSIVGFGNVGQALARRWSAAGHEVTVCVRDPQAPRKQAAAAPMGASLEPLNHASRNAVVLLAIPWRTVAEVVPQLGDLAGKIVLDCTNPVNPELTHLTLGFERSAGEILAEMLPTARIVKIFNTNGSSNMENPQYGDHRVTMLYAGDDAGANQIGAQLARDIGFEPVYLGPLRESRLLEPLAMAWIKLARERRLGREFALDVVRREA
ncbi:MAG TPA: NADPH-dependent F420 reductase [Pirellulales bacterium]|jgi:hypothetical protein|nr:NADPH-dependent F420 reductase [Pirellulales bacterium]